MKHLILAGILVILVTILLIIGASYARLLPVSASVQAIPIDSMFRKEFVVIAFLFSLIVVFMVYSIIAFRRKPGDMSDAKHIVGNHNLEVTWTVIPLIIVLAFSFLGAQALGDTQSVDPKPLEVNVIASQWVWRFDYPDSSVVSSDLVLPVNQQAVLHLSSKDVIHSFWVPEFRVKQDALPGGENFIRDLRVTPNKIGTYRLMCAELCGLNHSTMEANVIVMLLVDYQAWIATQSGESADPVQRGQKWVQQYGCLSCHTTDGTKKVGPTWKGVYGSTVTLQDGSTVTVDDAYIIESIKNPSAKIVQGFNNLMPASAGSDLKDQQIADIIAFIKSLK